ncbi:MAG TPA: SBBP repeat-containing protein, partial [Terriglobia bacterium]|nr:SBBP repeat-containing protein [Terriglobia bacterium]
RDIFVTELNPAGSALVYSTFFGGTQYDQGNGLALDGAGNTYIIGSTQSTDFPTKGPFQASNKGGSDGVVAKFDPSGSLVYSSYFGGKSFEGINGIAVDSAGNVYMSGYTQSADFPTVSPIQGTLTPTPGQPFGSDAFVAKINAAGSALVYSTFLGGSGSDFAFSIAVDSAGNAYVTGETNSTNFPLANAFQSKAGGGTCTPFPNFSQPATTPS